MDEHLAVTMFLATQLRFAGCGGKDQPQAEPRTGPG